MKILTLNFLTCAVKACKTSPAAFPLHIRDAELESVDIEFNELFIRNVLPRVEWPALGVLAAELGLQLPVFAKSAGQSLGRRAEDGHGDEEMDVDVEVQEVAGQMAGAPDPAELTEEEVRALHVLLLETQIVSGKLVCGNCGHEYAVKEGIANFLLPAHLVA